MNFNSLPLNSELACGNFFKTPDDEFEELVQEHIAWETLEEYDIFMFYNPEDPFYGAR